MRKSTGFEFQALRSVDILVLHLPIVRTGPRQSLLLLYFFIRGKKGRVIEGLLLNKVAVFWFGSCYSTIPL